jgi:hypothetical protein
VEEIDLALIGNEWGYGRRSHMAVVVRTVGVGGETVGDRSKTMGAAVGKAAGSRCRRCSRTAPVRVW